MPLTKMPSDTDIADPVESLMISLRELRNKALNQGDFESVVLLSHIHAWLFWINENLDELKKR